MSGRQLARYTSTSLICALLAVVIYRAKTQSFTIDEAFAFNLFVDQGLDQFLLVYDACNHFLFTLLTKFVRYLLGTSELVLRLVSLVGALLYFIVVRRLCRLTAGNGWIHVIGLAALALNPFVLDFLVAARGYGLAVALFLWAIYYSVRWLNEGREVELLWRAGLAAGLSIAANLTLLVPAAGLGATLLLLAIRRGRPAIWSVIDRFGGPAVILAFVFAVLPLARSQPSDFYFGSKTISEAVSSFLEPSVRYDPARSPFGQCGSCTTYAREVALPTTFVLMTGLGIGMLVRRMRNDSPDFTADVFVLSTITLALSAAALVAVHRLFSVPYPHGRSGLYIVVLFTISALATCVLLLRSSAAFRPAGFAGVGLIAATAVIFAAQMSTGHFYPWPFDASTNRLMDRIISDNNRHGQPAFSVASTSLYGPSLKYYRKRRKLHRMAPEIRTEELEKATADYFVLAPADRNLVGKLGLRILVEDASTGTIVARRSS